MKTLKRINLLNLSQIFYLIMFIGKVRTICLACLLASFSSCSAGQKQNNSEQPGQVADVKNEQAADGLPHFDIQKDYPKRTVLLDELASIEYIPLETTDDALIRQVTEIAMSGDEMLVCDKPTGNVLFYTPQGKLKKVFNKQGGGPHEYQKLTEFSADFAHKEFYVWDYQLRYAIQVYSMEGDYLRTLPVKAKVWAGMLFDCDEKHLLAYDDYGLSDLSATQFNEYPYILIDKQTGQLSPLPLRLQHRLGKSFSIGGYFMSLNLEPMLKNSGNGVVISDFAKDSVFVLRGESLVPIATRSHIGKDDSGMDLSAVCVLTDRYMLLDDVRLNIPRGQKGDVEIAGSKSLLCDRKSGEVSEVVFRLKDLDANFFDVVSHNSKNDLPDNLYMYTLRVETLLDLLEANKLSGRLKEVAQGLNPEDNPVLVAVKFAE